MGHIILNALLPHPVMSSQLDVLVSPTEAQALFKRFGFDTVMPYEQFVHNLVTQPSRQLANDMPGARTGCVWGFDSSPQPPLEEAV